MVHLIRSEGIELNDMPIPPVDKSKRPKGYVAKKPEEDPDWIEYWYATKIVSEYDQEIPQPQTTDNPVAPRGRAAQPLRDTRKAN